MKERITVQVFDLNQPLTRKNSGMARSFAFGVAVSLAAFTAPTAAFAQSESGDLTANSPSSGAPTYADLVDLAERSGLILRAEIRRQTAVEPERSPGLEPGFVRLYIEARTLALLGGNVTIGESLAFLVDVPLDARGKPAKYKGREVLLFADPVAGRPGSIQLISNQSMRDYTPALEARVRPILTELVARDRLPVVAGVREALAVRGTLAGESETQIFLDTQSGAPVSVTVLRRPGQPPVWGVSWGEIIDSSARAPAPKTLAWYRLACALPGRLPRSANLAREPQARRLAEIDYEFVATQLGACERVITKAD